MFFIKCNVCFIIIVLSKHNGRRWSWNSQSLQIKTNRIDAYWILRFLLSYWKIKKNTNQNKEKIKGKNLWTVLKNLWFLFLNYVQKYNWNVCSQKKNRMYQNFMNTMGFLFYLAMRYDFLNSKVPTIRLETYRLERCR